MKVLNRPAAIIVLLTVGILVFAIIRLFFLKYVVEEETAQGRIVSEYTCGERVRLYFYHDESSSPYRLFTRNDVPLARCVQRIFFLEPGCDEMIGVVNVYRDIEPDGYWDQRVVFSGRLRSVYPEGKGPEFEYFERDERGDWVRVDPIDPRRIFLEVVLGG